jgi:signal transduction histidine kinase
MSKSKEQCLNIIGKKFDNLKNEKDVKALFLALEEIIIDISGAEFGLVWLFNNDENKIKTFSKNREIELILEESILKTVLVSKRGFFDNYIVSHQKYNHRIDNPLNIKIKSMIVVPILDKRKETLLGFLSAYNSVKHPEELKRYDLRSLSLLESCAFNTISLLENEKEDASSETTFEPQIKKILKKKEELKTVKPIDANKSQRKTKTKKELEERITLQEEKIKSLENQLLLKTEAFKKQELAYEVDIFEEDMVSMHDIEVILNFLTNEVTYLANEEHKLYLFLEIIKNSLHNKEQLHFLNHALEKSKLIEKLANDLYNREKMPLLFESFNIYQLIDDIGHLYDKTLVYKNISLNISIKPNTPNFLTSDKDKIKSLIVHLMNNIFNFTSEFGAIELNVHFSEELEVLSIEIKGVKHLEVKKMKNFFAHEEISHSLSSSDSGLGLSVSSNLINILGGKLKLSTSGKNEHSFMAMIPMKNFEKEEKRDFFHQKDINVAILMSEENLYASQNLIRQLIALGIDEKFIVTFKNFKKMNNIKFSHLFCFENMFSSEFKFKNFSSVTLLKYSGLNLEIIQNKKSDINELYINGYYGLELQKIFFPNMKVVELEAKTLLIEDSFLSKFNNVVKKLTKGKR